MYVFLCFLFTCEIIFFAMYGFLKIFFNNRKDFANLFWGRMNTNRALLETVPKYIRAIIDKCQFSFMPMLSPYFPAYFYHVFEYSMGLDTLFKFVYSAFTAVYLYSVVGWVSRSRRPLKVVRCLAAQPMVAALYGYKG